MDKEEWIRLRVKMLRRGVTFESIATHHGVSRQWVFQRIHKGYPAKGKSKAILDDFYGRLTE